MRGLRVGAKLPEQIKTRRARHHHVQDRRIGGEFLHEAQRVLAAGGGNDLEPCGLQQLLQGGQKLGIVIHQKHPAHDAYPQARRGPLMLPDIVRL